MSTLFLFTFAPPQMWLQVVILVVGIAVVLWGADLLTKGAVGLAERMGIPQIVIGLTIVAMGTSMPEFFVSLMSAINGTPTWPWVTSWAAISLTPCLLWAAPPWWPPSPFCTPRCAKTSPLP